MSLKTSTSADGQTVTIEVKGKFDFNFVQDFRSAYSAIEGSIDTIIVDLRETEYMDSSALGMLLNMQKTLAGRVNNIKISNCKPQIKKILQISRFDKKFDID
ncbi:STAS domain-containing protein [Psychrosphaera saromensis]|uniref:Anti-sigma factor antagonist n=1 Tax=Psychrosphaera saromensis TaxID=716813 RepID=A0A2S7UY04_9GAMM|nr:STAS domain-containing protein [Psychrosphaera saromensis]PQJ54813.1 anti-anti-sigma factor [Psychrosphaera saromensis]GHB56910.1 STAS domain-containing protein [Psychrosphaera saromensis]GLQ13947.1 STAS domain-containing protein [Psychrosphaera saromensis]